MSAHPDATLPVTPLRAWRHSDRGFPWTKLEKRTGVPLRTIMAIAAGRRASPENAQRISKATGIPMRDLLGLPSAKREERVATVIAELDTEIDRDIATDRRVIEAVRARDERVAKVVAQAIDESATERSTRRRRGVDL
ncbi:helix-turn-helix domain-containing protein [Sandaracinus amylolyticus]|uniref:helix-turn-helix domain-containing protein n=1 Tax=Sandaracinus amylolyticus TaxID=927083 RepID=UPI0022A7364B|nr:helix-turn-helix domain-containing protein [Sandaracinus amylolyticus]UJR81472.1 Hypothetical protein I5071_35310 [Sandaracinus amylolyticus]